MNNIPGTADNRMGRQVLKNFSLTTGSYAAFLNSITAWAAARKPAMICVANVHMFVEAQNDGSFLSLVNNADMVTPDGKPLCWALNMLYGIKQDRVAGMDLLPDLLKKMEEQQLSVYFYGGSPAMLESTQQYLAAKHPGVRLAGAYSPPFRVLTEEENNQVLQHINEACPNVVFVILGCPKQEKWMASVKGRLQAVAIGVGGALPVMTGMQKRAPVWMQDAGLEWLYRLLQEPRRLFKRYAITNSHFIWVIIKEFFRIKFSKNK